MESFEKKIRAKRNKKKLKNIRKQILRIRSITGESDNPERLVGKTMVVIFGEGEVGTLAISTSGSEMWAKKKKAYLCLTTNLGDQICPTLTLKDTIDLLKLIVKKIGDIGKSELNDKNCKKVAEGALMEKLNSIREKEELKRVRKQKKPEPTNATKEDLGL